MSGRRAVLALIVSTAGCGHIRFEEVDGAVDGTTDAPPCTTWGPFGPPVRLPVSTLFDDWSPGLSFAGDELAMSYWDNANAGFDIASAHTDGAGGFTTPVVLQGLNRTDQWEYEPFFTSDGSAVYFTTKSTSSLFQIERAARTGASSFGPPTVILTGANYNHEPAVSADELRLYFTTNNTPPTNGNLQLAVASRTTTAQAFGPPTVFTELDDPTGHDEGATLSRDELEIIFTSERGGDFDLYRSTRTAIGAPWTAPARIAELSTGGDDLGPMLSADGATIYYNRNTVRDGGADSDVWRAVRACAR